ncbi:hypothetical protein DVH05_004870 [Phytophthora capsici]|nr:hypothetical protein DVH05_006646 [Phytophthora capsici]KAG1704841.1 hypothetical protein DVH05_004870 [Phytophthora capsici]|eukprot:jgi/Phyca11/14293/fgenesh1_pg.PHYCAscaffold_7_\
MKRKTQARFDENDNDALLKDVLAANPFDVMRGGKTAAWAAVASALALDVDARRCRECCSLLLTDVKAKMARSGAASGIDEEHTERDDLLADVLELFEDAQTVEEEKKQTKEVQQRDDERADAMRDEAMTGMKGKTSKHDKFSELMAHVKERVDGTRQRTS